MTRYQKPDVAEEEFCRCAPSHSVLDHGPYGCTHPVSRFYWNPRTQEYDIMNLRCTCRMANKVQEVERTVLEDEKQ